MKSRRRDDFINASMHRKCMHSAKEQRVHAKQQATISREIDARRYRGRKAAGDGANRAKGWQMWTQRWKHLSIHLERER